MLNTSLQNESVSINITENDTYPEILTDDALVFIKQLHVRFNDARLSLLAEREKEQAFFDKGNFPAFPRETQEVRDSDWKINDIPEDLQDRRVEITGPVDRKMVINALNSGAKTFMADFEDSNSPTWENVMNGQQNLMDANDRKIEFKNPVSGRSYQLTDDPAVLIVRPRGLHLNEKHVLIDGEEVSGSLFDFGLYVFHNTQTLLARNSAPYFYLPKLEHYKEARWWNEVFNFAQAYLHVPQGTFKATLLIETITASFQLHEFIYELKDHIVGLNCGRWDYIFSYIKKFRNHKDFVVPDRDKVTMTTNFMAAYSSLVIKVCHQRGVHAIGGMAAQIPIKNDPQANQAALEKVRQDKEREALNGHDGTWVAHPALVDVAKHEFDQYMPTANQVFKKRDDVQVTEADLVELPEGSITEKGLRKNINVGILYIQAWLSGNGAAALYHLMEDAATAEISRTQVWQWLHNQVQLEDGRKLDSYLFEEIFKDEVDHVFAIAKEQQKDLSNLELATSIFKRLVSQDEFEEFLTTVAYDHI